MPLEVLVTVVAIGLALVIGAVHLTGGTRLRPLDPAHVIPALLVEFEDTTADDWALVAADDGAAFICFQEDGHAALVLLHGHHETVRGLDANTVSRFSNRPDSIQIVFHGLDIASVRFAMKNDAERSALLARLTDSQMA